MDDWLMRLRETAQEKMVGTAQRATQQFEEALDDDLNISAALGFLCFFPAPRLNFEKTGKRNRHAFHDVGLAVGNLLVEATALGLFVHQMAGFSVDKVCEAYHVPEGFEPVAAIAIGYPAEPEVLPETFREQETGPRKRKPISSFVFEGAWAKTWPRTSK